MTLSAEQIESLVNTACREARSLADEADGLRRERDTFHTALNKCSGALTQWQDVDAQRLALVAELARVEVERDARVSRVWVVLGIAVGVALGFVGGWAVGSI